MCGRGVGIGFDHMLQTRPHGRCAAALLVDRQRTGAGLGKCAIQLSELAVQLAAAGNKILRRVDLLLDQLGGAVKLCAQFALGGVDRADLFVRLRGACVQFAFDCILMVDVHLVLGQP